MELDDVAFAYAHETVIDRVSVRLAPGEILGLLGRTGSGKTTISRLLFRLHAAASIWVDSTCAASNWSRCGHVLGW